MLYNIDKYSDFIDSYFFQCDEFYNIHVYKKVSEFEYLDMVELDYKYDYAEFKFQCSEWIRKNG